MLNLDFFYFPGYNFDLFEMTHFMEFGFFDRFSDKRFGLTPLPYPLIMLSCDLRLFCKQERIVYETSIDCAKNP